VRHGRCGKTEHKKGMFKREELPGRFIARKLFGWSDKKYDQEYWRRLERNWRWWKGKQLGRRKMEMCKKAKLQARIKPTALCSAIDKENSVTNFIWSYLCQFFDDSHGLKTSLKPLKRPFDRCQSRLEAINNG